jgi:DNA-directed RNA polymerase specialized sigma24 family protein
MLRAEQREALILVEAIRFSFGEAASRFRSLVEGARADLARHLERQQGERPNQKGVPLGFLPTA